MNAQVAALAQQMQELTSRLQISESRASQAEAGAVEARATAESLRLQMAQASPVPKDAPQPGNPYTAWASKYQPDKFLGQESEWKDWSRIFKAWAGRFENGAMGQMMGQAAESQVSCKVAAREGLADNSKVVAAELYHMLIFFVRGKALQLVLKAGEDEGLEAWRLLIRRYEPRDNATCVGKLVEILSSSFEGELMDKITEFERKVSMWEAEAKEAFSDKLRIGVVVKGLPAGSLKEHMLLAASKAASWAEFCGELEAIELAKKSLSSTPQPMSMDALDGKFAGKCGYCSATGHKEADCRKKKADKAAGREEAPKCSNCGRAGHAAKDCWWPKKDANKKGGPKGRGKKGKKGKGLHECEEDDENWPEDSQPQGGAASKDAAANSTSEPACEALGGLSICALGLEAVMSERDDASSRAITFGVDTAACRTVVTPNHPAVRGYKTHVDPITGTLYSTAGTAGVKDEGRRVLCAANPKGPDPLVLDTRSAKTRRPLMSVKEMTKKGGWAVFGPERGFLYRPQTQQIHEFTNTPYGWDWTLELEPPTIANQKVLAAIEQVKVEKSLPARAHGGGALPQDVPSAVREAICSSPFLGQAFRP